MSKRTILVGVSAAVLALGITAAQAQSKKGPVTHSAASLACSQQANAKGLHGKVRKKFREACKRQYMRGASTKSQQGYPRKGFGYNTQQGSSWQYQPQQGNTSKSWQGYQYKPQQGQGYKAPQDQGYQQPQGQQGQGGNPMKWW